MKIECLRKRPKGSVVTIGTETYHFKPEVDGTDGPHVADVTIKAHINRFLEIKEGYRRLPGEKPVKTDETGTVGTTSTNPGQGTDNAGDQQTGTKITDGNPNPDTDAPQPIAGAATPPQGETGNGEGQNDPGTSESPYLLEGTSDEDLRAIFEKEVGRKPSPKAGRDTMIAQIKAALEAAAE